MFVLASCQENIRIVPQDLHKEQLQAITDEIEQSYFDKVNQSAVSFLTLSEARLMLIWDELEKGNQH